MCFDENLLAAFIDKALNSQQEKEVLTHLDQCPLCLEKVFFLKKALSRESLFLKEPSKVESFKKVMLKIQNQGVLLLEKVKKPFALPLEIAFRDTHEKKKAVQILLDKQKVLVESINPQEFSLTLEKGAEMVVKNKENRILFQGFLKENSPLVFKAMGSFEVTLNQDSIILEMG